MSKQRILAVLIAGCISIVLAACSSGSSSDPTPEPTTGQVTVKGANS